MATKTFKIGLSATDKQNMAQDVYERILDLTFPEYDTTASYSVGDFVVYNDQLYKCIGATTGTWDATKWQLATLNDLVEDIENAVSFVNNKANVDGNYPTMTVGNSDQLNSTVYVVDKVPYLYRTSGGDADIGNREYDKIIGGSLVVNQHRSTEDISGSGSTSTNYEWIGRTTDASLVYGHKYLVEFDVKTASDNVFVGNYWFRMGNSGYNEFLVTIQNSSNKTHYAVINDLVKLSTNQTPQNIGFLRPSGDGLLSIEWENLNVIDLTQMFGSTIADYIYSLEQANAGAGVAWFRQCFKEENYPYNTGAIKNVKLVSHDMVGFNQWDEEWEVGGISNVTGQNETTNDTIRSKNFIRVIPNTQYYFKVTGSGYIGGRLYDKNYNFVGSLTINSNATFNIPDNVYYLRFAMLAWYGTTYNNDICINLSWSGWRNGQYEPYQKNSYPLDTTVELRGIPKLDSNNNIYFDGDEYSSDGKVVRRYGTVDLGTLSWTYDSTRQCFYASYTTGIAFTSSAELNNAQCGRYSQATAYQFDALSLDKSFSINNSRISSQQRIWIRDTSYNNADTFKTAMNGVMLTYELATPTEETATPFQEPQIVDDFGTEEYVVPTQDGWQVPVGHDTRYPANLRDKLQRLPDMPSVSQNVTETYVVNYNGTTKKCTFVDIAGWLGTNGWIKLTDISGYDATKTQTLKNVSGTLTWVDN